jgi:cytochrome c553
LTAETRAAVILNAHSTSIGSHALLLPPACAALAAVPARRTVEEKAQMCGGCHGENGVPQEKTTPVIWGQHQGYLYLQLRDYKRGDRKDDQMTPVVELLERDDMMALAEYFSKKPWPRLGQPPAPSDVATRAHRANGLGRLAPAAIRRAISARARSRASPASAGNICCSRCSTSAPASAATIPACPT